jgi:F0F1-type ATP synthase membrane subunit b/b'
MLQTPANRAPIGLAEIIGTAPVRENAVGQRQRVFWSLAILLLLSGCGRMPPDCDTSDTRDSVVKKVSGDSNNKLAKYAAKNSSAVEAAVNNASTEAERSAILERATRGASYLLDNAINTNSTSKDRRVVACSGLLSVTVDDATAQKQVDFKVEQTADGKMSVSVSPFQF